MEARCQYGQLTANIVGDGRGVMCHCKACQRRSGSPFGMMIYFQSSDVSMSGETTRYTRSGDSGDDATHGFCPICGTPFWLKTARHPDGIGIASGVIESKTSTAPVRSVFEEKRHSWITIPQDTQSFPKGRDS